MGYKPKPLGYKANAALEDVLSLLMDIERATGIAQKAVVDGKQLESVMHMSDIRTKAMLAHSTIVEARAGKYSE